MATQRNCSVVKSYCGHGIGRAVQVDPIKPKLTLPGTKRLKLKCDEPLSNVTFKV